MATYVVDYGRMRRLAVPDAPSLSLMTKICLVILAACIILLVKKYRDRQVSLKLDSPEEIVYPSLRDGL